jgi:hypothetical protein
MIGQFVKVKLHRMQNVAYYKELSLHLPGGVKKIIKTLLFQMEGLLS